MSKTREKVLILSTGGSAAPLLTAIEKHHPKYIIFLCSETNQAQVGSDITVDGTGEPYLIPGAIRPSEIPRSDKCCPQCGSKYAQTMPSIVNQAGLGKEYESYEKVIISSADSLPECYSCNRKAIQIARDKYPYGQIIIDYTGGTKTMSTGLAMAGVDCGEAKLYSIISSTNNSVRNQGDRRQTKSPKNGDCMFIDNYLINNNYL